MEKNVGENGKVIEESEEKRKQKVEDIAKQDTKKDSETATTDRTGKKIKDIDDIIDNDVVLSYGVKKLQEIGFGADYFKKLVKLQSSFSVGENEDQLIYCARNVFNALVIKITEDPNGIVLNADGSLNVEKSEQQKEEIRKINDVFSRSALLSKEKSKTIFDEVFKDIQEKQSFNRELPYTITRDPAYNPKNVSTGKEIETKESNAGVSWKDKQKIDYKYDRTDIKEHVDNNVIFSLYELKIEYQKILEAEKNNEDTTQQRAKLSEDLQKIKEESKESKFYEEIVDLTIDEAEKWLEVWEDDRNTSQIAKQLAQKKGDLENDKHMTLVMIARGYVHSDDLYVQKMLNEFLKNLGLNIDINDFDQIKGLFSSSDFNINSKEDIINLARRQEFNENTYQYKCEEITEALDSGKGRDSEYKENVILKEITENLNSVLNSGNVSANDKALLIMSLYNEFSNEGFEVKSAFRAYLNDEKIKGIINRFIVEQGNSIYGFNGEIDSNKIRDIISNYNMSMEQKALIKEQKDGISKRIEDINKTREKARDDIKIINDIAEEIRKLSSKGSDITKAELEKEAVEMISKVGIGIDPKTLENLRALQSETINEELDRLLKAEVKKVLTKDETEEDKLIGQLLYLEAKKEVTRNTPEYENSVKEARRRYEKDDNLRKKVEQYKNDGSLEKRVNNYIDILVHNTIVQTVSSGYEEGEKENYAKILLAGIGNSNNKLSSKSMERISEIYPELKSVDSKEFKKKAYEIVFGENFTDEQIQGRENEIIKNLRYITITNMGKLNDKDFQTFYDRLGSEISTKEIDVAKNKLQKAFENSGIEFSDENKESYSQLSNELLGDVWLSTKAETEKHYFIALCLEKQNGTLKQEDEDKLQKILSQNPSFKKLLDGKENLKSEVIGEENHYYQKLSQYGILEKLSWAITNPIDTYKDMDENKKKNLIEQAIYAYEYSKEIKDNPEYAEVFKKLAYGFLEKISTDEIQMVSVDENNQPVFNEENIFKFYKNINQRSCNFNTYKELAENSTNCQKKYILHVLAGYYRLNENDFVDLTNVPESERTAVMRDNLPKIKDKLDKAKTRERNRATGIRRYNFAKREILKLSKEEIDSLDNENIAAIWYTENKDFEKKTDPQYKEIVEKIKAGLIPEVASDGQNQFSIEDIDDVLGNKQFSDIFENNKKNVTNNIDKIKYIRKDLIDDFNNIKISALWYNELITDMQSRGLTEEATQLEEEFKKRFPDNKEQLQSIAKSTRTKIEKDIEEKYISTQEYDSQRIFKSLLGEEGNNFLINYAEVSKKIHDNRQERGLSILKNNLTSKDKPEYLLARTASIYNRVLMGNNEKQTSDALEILDQFILSEPEKFKGVIENGKVKLNELTKYSKQSVEQSKDFSIGTQLLETVQRDPQEEKNVFAKYAKINEFMETRNESDRKVAYKNMEDLLANGMLTDELAQKYKQIDPMSFKKLEVDDALARSDTWGGYAARAIELSAKFFIESYDVLTRKRSFKEVAGKVGTKLVRASERISKKVRQDRINSKNGIQQDRGNSKNNQGLLPPPKEKQSVKTDDRLLEGEQIQGNVSQFDARYRVDNTFSTIERIAIKDAKDKAMENQNITDNTKVQDEDAISVE